jgi:hypothetical protein
MAEFFPPVIFEIKAKATEAIASFKEVNGELAKMEKNGLLAGGALGKMEKAGKYAGTALLGLAGAFGVVAVASLKTLDSFEKSQVKLETAVKNTGVSFEAAQPIIKAHADSMKALGFSYTDTYDALSKMTAASGSPKVALDSLSTAADLARFNNISLADAGSILAKASVGATRGLMDMGLKMGVTIPKGASLAQIMKLIENRVGGAANAFKGTLGGSLAVAQANFQALEIQIGTKLLPTAIKFTDWVSKTAIPAMSTFFGFIKNNMGWVKAFAVVLGAIWATSKIASFISMIGKVVAAMRALAVAAGIAAVAEAFATGGLSVAAAGAALAGTAIPLIAAGAAVYGGVKLNSILSGGSKSSAATGINGTPGSTQNWSTPNLQGKGVTMIKPTPKKTSAPTVNQNITVYASNTNDIASKLSKAAKTGVPLGGK